MLDRIKNWTLFANKYHTHSEAVIISCYFNPQKSEYRRKAFDQFYSRIKHLNHRIIECVIGNGEPQLPESEFISTVRTESLLWHKESLLNKLISELPEQFKYVFWIDADLIFTNNHWLVEGVEKLSSGGAKIIQPFEYCIHLDKDELKPSFGTEFLSKRTPLINSANPKAWRSFCATAEYNDLLHESTNYNSHGHVGFAWGARREVLEAVPLYDRALIGGADHIIAHAAVGQIPHECISKSFTENMEEVNEWSKKFYEVVKGKIGYSNGTVYHLWHGDIEKRQYFKRVKDFTPASKNITKKDINGLYIADKKDHEYMEKYFQYREVPSNTDDGFLESMLMGYATDSAAMGRMLGGNSLGAMLGDMMNESDEKHIAPVDNVNTINITNPLDSVSTSEDQSQFDTTPEENFS